MKSIQNISIASWVLIFIVFILFSLAKEGRGVGANAMYNQDTLLVVLYLMILQLLLGLMGLVINTTRNRRKSDSLNKGLITSCVMAVFGILIYAVV
ncbi:MAG: hypothetical protein GY754_20915 [bacterium]|nr:hypothetical protein [bacterium]